MISEAQRQGGGAFFGVGGKKKKESMDGGAGTGAEDSRWEDGPKEGQKRAAGPGTRKDLRVVLALGANRESLSAMGARETET